MQVLNVSDLPSQVDIDPESRVHKSHRIYVLPPQIVSACNAITVGCALAARRRKFCVRQNHATLIRPGPFVNPCRVYLMRTVLMGVSNAAWLSLPSVGATHPRASMVSWLWRTSAEIFSAKSTCSNFLVVSSSRFLWKRCTRPREATAHVDR